MITGSGGDLWVRVGAGPPALCQVHGCARSACLTRLRVGTAAVCDDHLWECRIGVRAAALSTGSCKCCLAPVEGMETWILSSGYRVCATCADMESSTLSTPLEDPVSSCLSCSRALHTRTNSDWTGRPAAGPALPRCPQEVHCSRTWSCAWYWCGWTSVTHTGRPNSWQLVTSSPGRLVVGWQVPVCRSSTRMICPRWLPSVRSRCAASLRCLRLLRCAGSTMTVSVLCSIATLVCGPPLHTGAPDLY